MKKHLLYISLFTILLSPFVLKANAPENQSQFFDGEKNLTEMIRNDSLINISTYPNPFSTVVNFKFSLEEEAQVNIDIFNILGKKIETIHNSILKPGEYLFRWDGSSYDNGIYLYNFKIKEKIETGRVILRR